jgi:glycosyltransferase involved in cell wall biosynthesis
VEAYAHQVPVVATRTVGIQDIVVHGETGFLHEDDDVAGMVESVMTLIRDNELRSRMASAGNAFVRREFDPGELSRQWSQLSSARQRQVACISEPKAALV